MTGVVWAPNPSDLGAGLKAKPCMKLSYWWNHDEGICGIAVKHICSRFYPRSFLARSEWSGVQTVTGVGNLQHLKQLQHYVATRLPTRNCRMGYSSNLLDKALWSLYIDWDQVVAVCTMQSTVRTAIPQMFFSYLQPIYSYRVKIIDPEKSNFIVWELHHFDEKFDYIPMKIRFHLYANSEVNLWIWWPVTRDRWLWSWLF